MELQTTKKKMLSKEADTIDMQAESRNRKRKRNLYEESQHFKSLWVVRPSNDLE